MPRESPSNLPSEGSLSPSDPAGNTLGLLINAFPEPVWIVDWQGIVLAANQPANSGFSRKMAANWSRASCPAAPSLQRS